MDSTQPRIIARTERWLVLDKPAGWLTIPGRSPDPVLSEWASAQGARAWVVHRIDRETSGIVLFALSEESHREACAWFEQKKVRKRYDCLAVGKPAMPVLKLSQPIEGKPSLTQVEVRERFGAHAFHGSATPASGRRHQIRIHLSGAGHPLLGDPTYGGPRALEGLEVARVALHAASLALPTGERFEAPLPADFQAWIAGLRALAGKGHSDG